MPTMGAVDPGTAGDYAALCLRLASGAERLGISEISLHQLGMTYLPLARERLAHQAMFVGATHVLWIDADMRFPPYAAERLLQHDADIVGANYARRVGSGETSSYVRGEQATFQLALPEKLLKLLAPSVTALTIEGAAMVPKETGLEPAAMMGMGFCVVRAEVFQALAEPWFLAGYDAKGQWNGEDWVLCQRALAAGLHVVVDHEVSRVVGHAWSQVNRLDVHPMSPVEAIDNRL